MQPGYQESGYFMLAKAGRETVRTRPAARLLVIVPPANRFQLDSAVGGRFHRGGRVRGVTAGMFRRPPAKGVVAVLHHDADCTCAEAVGQT